MDELLLIKSNHINVVWSYGAKPIDMKSLDEIIKKSDPDGVYTYFQVEDGVLLRYGDKSKLNPDISCVWKLYPDQNLKRILVSYNNPHIMEVIGSIVSLL